MDDDVRVYGIGDSVAYVRWASDMGREWMGSNLAHGDTMWGDGVAVESRYLGDILTGMLEDGLTVGDGNGRTLTLVERVR